MRARPRPSISTDSCAIIICARRRSWAISRSISCPRTNASAPATRLRWRSARGSKGLAVPPNIRRSRSSKCRRVRRCSRRCSPKSMGRTPRRGAHSHARCARPSTAVDFVVDIDDSFGERAERLRFAIDQEALEYHGVEEQAVYDTIGALVGGVKIGFSQRGGGAKPIDITVALPRSQMTPGERILSTPLPAGGTRAPGRQCRTRRRGEGDARTGLLSDLPPQRPLRRNGERRSRGTFRGADLRHVRRRGRDRRSIDWGPTRPACDQISRPAARRFEADASVGRRMGGDLRHLPRHGRRLHGGFARHLSARRRAVRLLQTAARHSRAGAVDAARHRARASRSSTPPSRRRR